MMCPLSFQTHHTTSNVIDGYQNAQDLTVSLTKLTCKYSVIELQ